MAEPQRWGRHIDGAAFGGEAVVMLHTEDLVLNCPVPLSPDRERCTPPPG